MASKILVGLPQHGPFQSKSQGELFNLGYVGSQTTHPETRIKQLEQNIRYLQEQHQIMLSGLHREIETLRRRNRDLQFQMVFPKGNVTAVLQTTSPSSSLSSPEDDINKIVISPGNVNITPLQIELLERDLADLKTNLSESRTRNVYLQSIIDNKKEPENMQEKFDEAERMIRRLRRENEEQRKEIISLRVNIPNAKQNRHRQNQYSQTTRFPPLNQNPNWHNSKNDKPFKQKDGEQSCSNPSTLPLLKGPSTSHGNRRGYPHRGSRIYRNNHRDQSAQQD